MALLTVELKNPPAGATKWALTISNWGVTESLGWETALPGPIGELASFDVPDSWEAPFRVIQLNIWAEGANQIYSMQSWKPLLWDFATWDWDGPDPTYRNAFLPGPGDYFYNVATEQFELKALPVVTITAPDNAAEGDTVLVSGVVTNLDSAYGYEFKTEILVGTTVIETWQEPIFAGQSKTYQTAFIMPGGVANVLIWVTRRNVSLWSFVGAAAKDVALSAGVPPAEFANFGFASYTQV